jgi:hypothetical protein
MAGQSLSPKANSRALVKNRRVFLFRAATRLEKAMQKAWMAGLAASSHQAAGPSGYTSRPGIRAAQKSAKHGAKVKSLIIVELNFQ